MQKFKIKSKKPGCGTETLTNTYIKKHFSIVLFVHIFLEQALYIASSSQKEKIYITPKSSILFYMHTAR